MTLSGGVARRSRVNSTGASDGRTGGTNRGPYAGRAPPSGRGAAAGSDAAERGRCELGGGSPVAPCAPPAAPAASGGRLVMDRGLYGGTARAAAGDIQLEA